VRIVFLGTPEAAVPTLVRLLDAGHTVPLVVTRPDRPVGRSGTPQPPPVKRLAEQEGLEIAQPEGIRRRAFRERLADVAPEILVVVAYGRILPSALLTLPVRGAVNLHFSLLPRYRGAAPVQWSLARGERTTGVTTMRISPRLDEGDIYLQRRVEIEAGEHAPSLEGRLALVGAELLIETLAALEGPGLAPMPQDDAEATLAPLLRREDGYVDPADPAPELEGRVRGFDPWPGVWLSRRGRKLRIVEARVAGGPPADAQPGTLLEGPEGGVELVCGAGSRLQLLRVQPEGRRALEVRDALNGRQLELGERLERTTREA
jgi:methionyl-tRNA formyltransferase